MNLENCKSVEEVLAWLDEDDAYKGLNYDYADKRTAALRQVEKLTLERAAMFYETYAPRLKATGYKMVEREVVLLPSEEATANAIRALSPTNPKEAK